MKNVVHNCDCLEFMKELPDNHYDLAIVDPPYGINITKMNMGSRYNILPDKKSWDIGIPSNVYFTELFRVSINQIIWGGNYFNLEPSRCFLIWDKGETMKGRDFAEAELAWTSFDKVVRIFKLSPNQKDRIHSTQKPVALYKWLLENYAEPGQRIFDSHVGSGSIRIACYDMGFEFEGCELDKEYWEAQETRFNNYKSQGELFGKNEYQELIYKKRG